MNSEQRRQLLLQMLNTTPISATSLAAQFSVSRQVIVGDIALLRAKGANIISTPRGYIVEKQSAGSDPIKIITCRHTGDQLLDELCTIVDNGARVLDVIVEHEVYGQIQCDLRLSSRYDCERFAEKIMQSKSAPLSELTGGIHLHTIQCPDEECYNRIVAALKNKKIFVD